MVKCWASSLGNCSHKQSREHIISKSIIKDFSYPNEQIVDVYGVADSNEVVRRIGISSLSAKMLCTYHNAALSTLDSAAAEALNAFREVSRLVKNARSHAPTEQRSIEFEVDGALLERWFLKTTINLLYCPPHNIKKIPIELVEIVFGIRKYPHETGLCIAGIEGGQYSNFEGDFMFMPLINSRNEAEISLFDFRGWKFALPLTDSPLPAPLPIEPDNPHKPAEDLARYFTRSKLVFHIKQIEVVIGNYAVARISFKWN